MAHEREHPVGQPIRHIQINSIEGRGYDGDGDYFMVGERGVTLIEACTKSGLHADMAYVRVWKGDVCEAEFCQHNIVGVYFGEIPVREPMPMPDDHTGEPNCACYECIPF